MKADERIKNIKIYVDGRSAEVQKKLFELGAKWAFGYGEKIQFTDKPFIFVSDGLTLLHGTDMGIFIKDRYKEVKADELLSWEPEKEEQKFEPFQKVLVRQGDGEVWFAGLFAFRNSKYDYLNEYECVGGKCWKQCIPYEGNEHLLGSTDDPEKGGSDE